MRRRVPILLALALITATGCGRRVAIEATLPAGLYDFFVAALALEDPGGGVLPVVSYSQLVPIVDGLQGLEAEGTGDTRVRLAVFLYQADELALALGVEPTSLPDSVFVSLDGPLPLPPPAPEGTLVSPSFTPTEVDGGSVAVAVASGNLEVGAAAEMIDQLRVTIVDTTDSGTDALPGTDSGSDAGTDVAISEASVDAGLPGPGCDPAAVTFVVTTTDDELDTPGATTVAEVGGLGDISLREALVLSTGDGVGNTILFDTGVFPPLASVSIPLTSPLPDVPASTCIDGVGAGVLIDASGVGGGGDVLTFPSPGSTLAGVTVSSSPDDGVTLDAANLTVRDVFVNGSASHGIRLNATADNATIGPGNIITNNGSDGVNVSGSTSATIFGNFIGTNPAGVFMWGNDASGIVVRGGAVNTTIGGSTPGDANVILWNGASGISINDAGTTGTVVDGNLIGTNAAFTATSGNSMHGIRISSGATASLIVRNVIGFNTLLGIYALNAATQGHTFAANLIAFNGNAPISLGAATNGGILPPTIQSADAVMISGVATVADGSLIDIYSGAGEAECIIALGVQVLSGSWTYSGLINGCGPSLVATVTDPTGNTSILSTPF